jgi:predicted dehydrogenase
MPGVRMKTAVDLKKERLRQIGQLYHGVQTTSAFDEVLEEQEIDAVLVATPVSTHHALAKRALLAGKHVLVEKRWRPASWKRRR